MHILFIFYNPTDTYITIEKRQTSGDIVFFSKKISSKEITKLFVFTVDLLLKEQGLSLDAITAVAVSVGPAPAFAQRSLLAAINGIKTARNLAQKSLSLYVIDDFLLTHQAYQNRYPKKCAVSLYNAFSQELFYVYTGNGEVYRGVWSNNQLIEKLQMFDKNNLVIIGMLSEDQKKLLQEAGITYEPDFVLSDEEFCRKAAISVKELKPVEFLFPQYTKLHPVEKNF